jgi:hypothetical protein
VYAEVVIPVLAAALSPTPAADAEERVVIDLTVPTPCAPEAESELAEEIRVCARLADASPYRIGRSQVRSAEALPRAEVALAEGATLSAETESADLGMARAQRAMVRLKITF